MTLLQRSDQTWKIYLFMALFVLGSLATLLQGFLYASLGRELAMQRRARSGFIVGWEQAETVVEGASLHLFRRARLGHRACTGLAKASRILPGCGEGETWVRRRGPGVLTRGVRFTPGLSLSSLRLVTDEVSPLKLEPWNFPGHWLLVIGHSFPGVA